MIPTAVTINTKVFVIDSKSLREICNSITGQLAINAESVSVLSNSHQNKKPLDIPEYGNENAFIKHIFESLINCKASNVDQEEKKSPTDDCLKLSKKERVCLFVEYLLTLYIQEDSPDVRMLQSLCYAIKSQKEEIFHIIGAFVPHASDKLSEIFDKVIETFLSSIENPIDNLKNYSFEEFLSMHTNNGVNKGDDSIVIEYLNSKGEEPEQKDQHQDYYAELNEKGRNFYSGVVSSPSENVSATSQEKL